MDNQEINILEIKTPAKRGRPKKEPTEPKEPKKPVGRPKLPPKEPKEPKRRGRPQINLTKVYYKPKDPDYFKTYYHEKTKIKRLEKRNETKLT
jgi:hypothetical protein